MSNTAIIKYEKGMVPATPDESIAIPATPVEQVVLLTIPTPPHFIKQRKGRGGDVYDYIETNYVIARLNATFFYDWDIEVLWQEVNTKEDQVAVKVRLRVRMMDGRVVTKEAYGSSDVKRTRGTSEVVDLADDLKAAESDGLKKAASMLGIGWDVYAGLAGKAGKVPKAKKEDKGFLDDIEGVGYSDDKKEEQKESFRTIALRLSDGTLKKVSKFEALEYFKRVKEAIEPEAYYAILKLSGYDHANKIPPKKLPVVYATLVDAFQGRKKVKKAEPQDKKGKKDE